ncbi:unnamed protein product [Coregonus sp. 'balchen']|nr:unnamed protein product [Coregonus sp. 'balchen']
MPCINTQLRCFFKQHNSHNSVCQLCLLYIAVQNQNNAVTNHKQLSTHHKGLVGPLPDLSVFQVAEAFRDFDTLDKPLVTTMGMSNGKLLVKSAFGTLQKDSVLSYQQPMMTRHIQLQYDDSPCPLLPLEDY